MASLPGDRQPGGRVCRRRPDIADPGITAARPRPPQSPDPKAPMQGSISESRGLHLRVLCFIQPTADLPALGKAALRPSCEGRGSGHAAGAPALLPAASSLQAPAAVSPQLPPVRHRGRGLPPLGSDAGPRMQGSAHRARKTEQCPTWTSGHSRADVCFVF